MTSPKYNRTFHLLWSPGATSDDKMAHDVSSLLNIPIVVSEKVDGSNVSLETDAVYARSHANVPTHPSFDLLKALHSQVKHLITPDYQVFGEWVFAVHSLAYDKLPGYFLAFGVRDLRTNRWASWDNVEATASGLAVPTVPVLFRGVVKTDTELERLTCTLASQPSALGTIREGVVVRVAGAFDDKDFSTSVNKMVRANHVQTDEHWMHKAIVKNQLK